MRLPPRQGRKGWIDRGAVTGSVFFRCDHCASTFTRKRYRQTGSHDFCNAKCAAAYRAAHPLTPQAEPSWLADLI